LSDILRWPDGRPRLFLSFEPDGMDFYVLEDRVGRGPVWSSWDGFASDYDDAYPPTMGIFVWRGEIIHRTDVELDEEGIDGEGRYWGDIESYWEGEFELAQPNDLREWGLIGG
jgi:hypothetical protein